MAYSDYSTPMKANPIIYCNLIIHSQIEYSMTEQAVILRAVLEMPTIGQRQGFTDMEALLAAIRAELTEIQGQIIPSEQEKRES